MGIGQYLKEIARGKQGARSLPREQAADLFAQVLDGAVTDLEIGAFCIAMRVKGETPEEMCGFIDATRSRMRLLRADGAAPVVVLPSYNGARRLPVLTPLLAMLVAGHGIPVVIHGTATESSRVPVSDLAHLLEIPTFHGERALRAGEVVYVPTEVLCPGLKRLLDVRRVVNLRNSAHSLVKLINPCEGDAVVVSSYTHPEYAISMAAVFEMLASTALLLRGTEGEAVADARRLPQMDGFVRGQRVLLEAGRKGAVAELPAWPQDPSADNTVSYIRDVLADRKPVPPAIEAQVEHILRLARA